MYKILENDRKIWFPKAKNNSVPLHRAIEAGLIDLNEISTGLPSAQIYAFLQFRKGGGLLTVLVALIPLHARYRKRSEARQKALLLDSRKQNR